MAVALVVAAGRGERLGSNGPKAFAVLGGQPMLEWSVAALRMVPAIEQIIVAMPDRRAAPAGTRGVLGAGARSGSVRAALAAAPTAADVILIHDAARPLVTTELIERVLAALDGVDAAIAAAPVTDTTKQTDANGLVLRTIDRDGLWAVQTPQVFRRDALERALEVDEAALAGATDEASLIERRGGSVRIVEAPRENLKVTTPLDLLVAEQLLAARDD
jgi:2-C-methyl-D-erythritol 4-phosphate cytidylyltransferase